jgi:hypothetical protein
MRRSRQLSGATPTVVPTPSRRQPLTPNETKRSHKISEALSQGFGAIPRLEIDRAISRRRLYQRFILWYGLNGRLCKLARLRRCSPAEARGSGHRKVSGACGRLGSMRGFPTRSEAPHALSLPRYPSPHGTTRAPDLFDLYISLHGCTFAQGGRCLSPAAGEGGCCARGCLPIAPPPFLQPFHVVGDQS